MTEKRYFKNTAILFVSMAITKAVGALFKIPLANLLGGTGMGYFSTAYGLYSPVFALTAAAIPTVIMRITARSAAVGNLSYAAAVRKKALILFSFIGLLGTLAVGLLSHFFAEKIALSPESTPAVICISPAVMLCCIASVLRGYREGLADVMPTAAAAVAESVSRAIFGLSLSYAVIFFAGNAFSNGRSVFGTDCATMEQAYNAALPYAAAGAVLAVSISELCGLITLIINEKRKKNRISIPIQPCRTNGISSMLIKDTIPIAASALVMNTVSFADLLTVTRTLSRSFEANRDFISLNYGNIMDKCGGISGLPNFMYGSYTGIAQSIFMLIPALAGMTSTAAAPEIAALWERKEYTALSKKIALQMRMGALIACPAFMGAASIAEPILTMLYNSRPEEVSVCLNSFIILCMGGIFSVISSAIFSVFQSVSKAHIPLILMSCSVIVKFILNPILMSVPELNISGAALATVIGYFITAVGGAAAFKKIIPGKTGLISAVLPPFICAVGCGLSAFFAHKLLCNHFNNTICVILCTIIGAIIYAILLILTGCFGTSGIIKQNFLKKSEKALEKK